MTNAQVIFIPNKFVDESYMVEVEPCSFKDAIEKFTMRHPSQLQPLFGKKISIVLNGKALAPELVAKLELEAGDVVEITNTIEGDVLNFIWTGLTWGWTWITDLFDFDFEMEEDAGEDQTYAWDGPRTSSKQGGVVPVVYGTHGVGGTYINFNLWSDGEDNYADMLVALCEGVIGGVRNEDDDGDSTIPTTLEDVDTATPWIKLNDQFITEYEDAEWAGRTGTNNQTSIQGFRDINTLYDYEYNVPAERDNPGGQWTLLYTTNANVDGFTLKMQADALYNYNSKGKMRSNSVYYRIRYRVGDPEGSWTYEPTNVGDDDVSSYYQLKGKSQSPTKENRTIYPAAGRNEYDLQVQRYNPATTSDDARNPFKTIQITEIVSEDLAYPNTAILAIRVKATDQMSGTFPEILTMVKGRKVRVPDLAGDGSAEYEDYYWSGTGELYRHLVTEAELTWDGTSYATQYTSNPAYCMRDFLINTRFGAGDITLVGDLDETAINNAAKRCWQKVEGIHKNELHYVVSEQGSPVDALKQMALVSRMFVFWSGGYVKFKYLEDEDPVQLLTMGNIVENKFSTTYIAQSSIPNLIEISYADKEDNYKEATREIVEETEWALGKPQRRKAVDLKGITSNTIAIREGKYHLNLALYRRRSVTLTTTAESLHCEPGDVVAVQHDVPQWGYGGRIGAGSTSTTAVLDVQVPDAVVSDPTSYTIKIIQRDDDAIETKDIASVSGNVVTISGSWSTTPTEDSTYLIGVDGTSIKEYRVQNMTINKDDTIALTLYEHSASIYSDTGLAISDDEASELPNPTEFAPQVENLTLYELHNEIGIGVSFRQPEATLVYDHAEIWISIDNASYQKYGDAYGSPDVEIKGLLPGFTYYVRVYSINKVGVKNRSPVEGNIQLTGETIRPPASPTGLEIDDGGVGQGLTTTFSGRGCKFRWNLNAPYAGAGSLEPQKPAGIPGLDPLVVKDFKVEIWNYTSTIKLREEWTTNQFYIYSYDKNYEDTSGIPLRQFQIKVWQRNWSNLLSVQPAILAVSNPAPDMSSHTPSLEAVYRGARIDFSAYTITDNDMDYFKVYYGYSTNPSASVDNISWRNQHYTISNMQQLAKIYVQIEPFDSFGSGTKSQVASIRTQGFDFVDAADSEWALKADAVVASIIKNTTITASKMGVASLSAIAANIGEINAGYIDGVIITGGMFRTAATGKRIQITSDGMSLSVTDNIGGYDYIRYGDNDASNASVFFGAGAVAYIHHLSEAVPFYMSAEQSVGDFHFYPRSADPSGAAEIGDVAVVNASLKICISPGAPGTWVCVGDQTGV
jgi:hypothetical protein